MFFLLLFLQRYLHPYTYLYYFSSSHVIPAVGFHFFLGLLKISRSTGVISAPRNSMMLWIFSFFCYMQRHQSRDEALPPGSRLPVSKTVGDRPKLRKRFAQARPATPPPDGMVQPLGVDSVDSVAIWANQPSLQPLSFAPIIATVCGPLFLLLPVTGSAAALVFTLEMCHILKPSKTEKSLILILIWIYMPALKKKDRIY